MSRTLAHKNAADNAGLSAARPPPITSRLTVQPVVLANRISHEWRHASRCRSMAAANVTACQRLAGNRLDGVGKNGACPSRFAA